MIRLRIQHYFSGLLLVALLVFPLASQAQSPQILSVTPPLFQLSVAPGDIWQSTIKVVNGNSYELPVYAEIVNFAPEGEGGLGRFLPMAESDEKTSTLADWIEINPGPYVVPPEQSKEISFFVELPEDAPPGGHFAAIIIGTRPPENSDDRMVVQASQAVTSLFFVRVAGDIVELGDIRQFSMQDTFVETPFAEFLLRFENKGNVHLQPRGDIVITNMWGSERGIVPVNHQSHFGNVLPDSVREFVFAWEGEQSITELGRYKAVATLAYGEDGVKSVTSIAYFWVVPVKATLITVGSIALFVLFVAWVIRMYIRRMLALAGVDVQTMEHVGTVHTVPEEEDVNLTSYTKVSAPLRSGIRDFANRMKNASKIFDVFATLFEFVLNYKIFFISILVIIIGFVGGVMFISEASKDQRSYEITIENDDGTTVVTSEEIIKDRIQGETHADVNPEQHFELSITNASGEAGTAAEIAVLLEGSGYAIGQLETSKSGVRTDTIILYDISLADEASALSSMLDGALLSATQPREITPDETQVLPKIQIILGSDTLE